MAWVLLLAMAAADRLAAEAAAVLLLAMAAADGLAAAAAVLAG